MTYPIHKTSSTSKILSFHDNKNEAEPHSDRNKVSFGDTVAVQTPTGEKKVSVEDFIKQDEFIFLELMRNVPDY